MEASLGLYLLLIFLFFIFVGVPIAIAIGVSSVLVMLSVIPYNVVAITSGQKLATGIDSFSLLAVP